MPKKYICKECGKEFDSPENLGKHIKHHMSREEYYIKWIKKDTNDGICPICYKKTNFIGVESGYRKYCSMTCKRIGAGHAVSNTWNKRLNFLKQTYNFQCLECGEKFSTSIRLNKHIIKNHGKKEYYDNHLKKNGEDKCKICGKKTNFTGRLSGEYSGYKYCCSNKCANIYRYQQRSKTNLLKYGFENPFQSEEIKKKIKQTFINNYGVDNNMKSEKGKTEYKKSMMKKYNVEWPLQNKNILDKNQKSAKTLKRYKDTSLWYQGLYEKEFLDLYLIKYPDIQRGPSIKYTYKNKDKVYHSDFYIPSLNLVVEIKSSWILKIDKESEEKKNAVINNGFKYIMILDKNYNEFNL